MDSFSPLTTSSLNIHNLEIFTANLVIQGNATGPYRRASDLVNRKDRDYIILEDARITPLGRQPSQTPIGTSLMVARQHTHLVALAPQPDPEHTTGGLGQYRESAVHKVAQPCYIMTGPYVIIGRIHVIEGGTLENLLAISELFLAITNATIYVNTLPNAPLQRDLVIVNRDLMQAMYLTASPTATQKLGEPPAQSTSPLRDRISSSLKDQEPK